MTRHSVPARWLLLCALALGVVAMHHVPAEHGSMAPMPVSAAAHESLSMPGPQEPDRLSPPGHSPLHECLAVLTAVVVLLLVTVLLRRRPRPVALVRRPAGGRRVARPPPTAPAGRLLLAAHCVLRI
ncbi:DUF6153 family protein [Amycolatopsis stemonae]